jgi:Flp pilus assembly secretin CpaC
VATLVATTTDGKTVYTPQTLSLTSSHMTLKVTPKDIKEDGKILLRVERETTSIGEGIALKVKAEKQAESAETTEIVPSMSVQNTQLTVLLPDGGTAVLGNTIVSTRDKTQKSELIWVFTAHLLRGKP